jgi:GT2 family glycosyltransferase
MSTLPLISIVVPNMSGMEHLPECFASLAAADYPLDRQEWILSDNGSRDESLDFIRREYPRTRIVDNGGNIGFARGCNAGAQAATGEYVVFLNNDTRVDPGWLHGYLSALARDPEAVCAASYMRSWDDTESDFNGSTANLFGVGRQQAMVGWPDCPAGPGEGDPLLFACGGAMLIRRDVFLAVGGFDPSFFIYFEDVDLGWRLWVLGHRVVFAPRSIVYHKEGGTTGAKRAPSHRRYLFFEANTLCAVFKNYAGEAENRVLPAALLLELQRALLAAGDAVDPEHYRLGGSEGDAGPANGHPAALPPMTVAHLLAMRRLDESLPHLVAERASIQAARRRPDSAILPLFRRPFQPQFAGARYSDAMRRLAAALDLYPLVAEAAPSRVLLLSPPAGPDQARASALQSILNSEFLVQTATSTAANGGWTLPAPPVSRADGFPPPTTPELAATADLLLAVGAALPAAATLAPAVPLAADVATRRPDSIPPAWRAPLAQRTGLLICADPATAAAWHAALPDLPVAIQPDSDLLDATLRHYCRYPLHGRPA